MRYCKISTANCSCVLPFERRSECETSFRHCKLTVVNTGSILGVFLGIGSHMHIAKLGYRAPSFEPTTTARCSPVLRPFPDRPTVYLYCLLRRVNNGSVEGQDDCTSARCIRPKVSFLQEKARTNPNSHRFRNRSCHPYVQMRVWGSQLDRLVATKATMIGLHSPKPGRKALQAAATVAGSRRAARFPLQRALISGVVFLAVTEGIPHVPSRDKYRPEIARPLQPDGER
jgi:hypothetical protein